MKVWMLPWLFPVTVITTIAALSLSTPLGYALAVFLGWVAFPSLAAYMRSQTRGARGGSDDIDTQYWRITSLR